MSTIDDKDKVAPHLCGICNQPKKLLSQKTNLMMSPIYVCATMGKKNKMPCDGYVFEISTK